LSAQVLSLSCGLGLANNSIACTRTNYKFASSTGLPGVMESDTRESLTTDLPLPEPHFDEEATLLSARPVVPLEKVQAKTRFTQPWAYGLALVGALLLGVSATAIYYSRIYGRNSTPFLNSETIPSGVEASAAETDQANVPSATPVPMSSDQHGSATVQRVAPAIVDSQIPDNTKKPVARRFDVLVFDSRGDRERREARKEEKERKREAKRESRENKFSDNPVRIREIFEGRRNPY